MQTHPGDTRNARPRALLPPDTRGSEKRRVARARLAGAAEERERLARDLHDGIQNELVSLIIGLSTAEEDRDTPPVLAARLSGLRERAQATLTEIREMARGNRPLLLSVAGVTAAIREQAERGSLTVSLFGSALRSRDAAEEAVYFACVEALQNAAKHAPNSHVTVRLRQCDGKLAVRIEDDGDGFLPEHNREGSGLRNIRDRIIAVGGTSNVTSIIGHGTVVEMTVSWPSRQTAPIPTRAQLATMVGTSRE